MSDMSDVYRLPRPATTVSDHDRSVTGGVCPGFSSRFRFSLLRLRLGSIKGPPGGDWSEDDIH